MRIHKTTGIGFLLLVLLTGGCGPVATVAEPDWRLPETSVVAVLPLRSLAGHPNGGEIVAELLQAELQQRGVPLVQRDKRRTTLMPLQATEPPTGELGAALGATHLLTGAVTEYGYKRGPGEEPVVGVSLQLIDVESGRVVWRAVLARTGRRGWISEDSLSRVAQAVARELAAALPTGSTP